MLLRSTSTMRGREPEESPPPPLSRKIWRQNEDGFVRKRRIEPERSRRSSLLFFERNSYGTPPLRSPWKGRVFPPPPFARPIRLVILVPPQTEGKWSRPRSSPLPIPKEGKKVLVDGLRQGVFCFFFPLSFPLFFASRNEMTEKCGASHPGFPAGARVPPGWINLSGR